MSARAAPARAAPRGGTPGQPAGQAGPAGQARPLRLMVIGISYAPEMVATAVYTAGMAGHMAARGWAVQVVTAQPHYPDWRVFAGWRWPPWRRRTCAAGVRIVHCPLYVPRTPTGVRRIVHDLTFNLSALLPALIRAWLWRPDVVMLVAPALVGAPVALWAARLAGAASWLHIQDWEVEAAFATGLIDPARALGRAALAFEARTLRRFDRVSSISAPMLARARHKGVAPGRTALLRNWADLDTIAPTDPAARAALAARATRLRAQMGIATPWVALYSGTLTNKQGLEILPQVARALAHRTDLTLAVCGAGPMRDHLARCAADTPRLRLFGLQPRARLAETLAMADVHLLPQIAGAADLVLPSKLANMLASGRPVVATAHPHTALGRAVAGAGVLVAPGDAPAMAGALEALIDDPARRARLGRAAEARARDQWDPARILSSLETQLADLAGRGAPSPGDGPPDAARASFQPEGHR